MERQWEAQSHSKRTAMTTLYKSPELICAWFLQTWWMPLRHYQNRKPNTTLGQDIQNTSEQWKARPWGLALGGWKLSKQAFLKDHTDSGVQVLTIPAPLPPHLLRMRCLEKAMRKEVWQGRWGWGLPSLQSQSTVALPNPEGWTKSLPALQFRTKSWGQTLHGLQKTLGTTGFAQEYVPSVALFSLVYILKLLGHSFV